MPQLNFHTYKMFFNEILDLKKLVGLYHLLLPLLKIQRSNSEVLSCGGSDTFCKTVNRHKIKRDMLLDAPLFLALCARAFVRVSTITPLLVEDNKEFRIVSSSLHRRFVGPTRGCPQRIRQD